MEEEIDLKNILKMFWDKKIEILIAILICTVIGFIYTTYFVEPVYTATSTAVLANNNADSGDGATVTQNDLSINDKLVSTYRGIATSDSVISKVLLNLGINNINEEALKKQISVTVAKNAQIISFSVQNKDANLSAKISNELRTVFAERAAEIYNIDNIKPLDDAKVPTEPSNINHAKDIVIFLAIGIVLGIAYAIVANMLDNTIKNAKDIEKATGLNVIAEIPVYDFNRGRKK